jgi:predicted dehydrogenase
MNPLNRRRFLATAASAFAAPCLIPARALGADGGVAPSARITLGAIGIGPRGRHVLECMVAEPDVHFLAICDVQRSRRDAVKQMADQKYGNQDCAIYRDFFELLARRDIDAVLIATGDHWHTLASIHAAKAGKDIYCEKPCGITIGQCQALDDTIKRYGRVFQAGTQRRSVPYFQIAIQLAQSGKLGKLKTMHASIYRPRVLYDWLPAEEEPPRHECDWDRWLGPSPWRPYNKKYVGGGWRGYYDFDSGGTLLDWGAHTIDLCQWANQADATGPVEYEPTKDNVTARYANGVTLIMDYLNTPFGNRDPQYRTATGTCPVRFEGEDGWVETGDSGLIEVFPASLKSEIKAFRKSAGTNPAQHTRNFFDCIKTRALPAAHSGVMRRSHSVCHAAAMAWMLNRKTHFDPVKEEFLNDDEANRSRHRAMREPWHI